MTNLPDDVIERMVTLVDRIEAATGPDREVDAAIAAALRIGTEHAWAWNFPAWEGRADGRVYLEQGGPSFAAPAYTASIDAAMTLVPKDVRWTICNYRSPRTVACVNNFDQGSAITPALAICAAALRARLNHSSTPTR